MSDFNLPNLMTWKKQNIKFESIFNDKKKVGLVATLIIITVFTFTAGFLKIHSLQEEKKRHELELTLLRQSDSQAKKIVDNNSEKLRRLNARVDNIISSDNGNDYSVLGVSTSSAGASGSVQANSSNNTSTNVNSSIPSISPVQSASVKGRIEIYDPVRKTIDVYKDATTFSQVVGVETVGEVIDYYQKTSGWYQIQLDGKAVWINEKYVHILK